MAFSVVNHVVAQSTDTNTITSAAIDTSTADRIIMVVVDYGPPGASAISDSKMNSYGTSVTQLDPTNLVRVRLMTTDPSPSVGSGHTFTATITGGYPAIAVLAVKGSKLIGLPQTDQIISNNCSSSLTLSPGAAVPQYDNTIIITGVGFNVPDTTATIDSGFTIQDQLTNVSGTAFGISLAYIIQTTATNVTPTWTFSTVNTTAAVLTSFISAPAIAGYLLIKN